MRDMQLIETNYNLREILIYFIKKYLMQKTLVTH